MEQQYFFYMIAGYLSGSMLFGYAIPKVFRGIDVTEESKDGNPGTFNAFACGGVFCGLVTLFAELGKGFWPVFLCLRGPGAGSAMFALVMAAPVLGHAFSVFHRGKGGKAIAVSFGVLLGLLPLARPLAILVVCYLFFTLALPVKSHRKRTVVTFLCFTGSSLLLVKQQAVLLGSLLISGVVIHKHSAAAMAAARRGGKWRLE